MATGAWVHNFPASKDEHPTYINWPTVGYDIIIAAFLHSIFTALDAIQNALGYNILNGFADLNTRLEQLDHVTKAHGFYDRGDPASVDYVKGDLVLDGTWQDLDLSGIIPVGAVAGLLHVTVEGNSATWSAIFRKKGNVNEINHAHIESFRANVERSRSLTVFLDSSRVCQYKADNVAWTTFSIAVVGWHIR